jgi:hypothetical protein
MSDRVGNFVVGQCGGHGFGSGIEAVKDKVEYQVVCQNDRCVRKMPMTGDFSSAQFRAETHARDNRDHPTLLKTIETYRDGHQHEIFASPSEAVESANATGYTPTPQERKDAKRRRR